LFNIKKLEITKLGSLDIENLLSSIQEISEEVKSHDQSQHKFDVWNWQYKKIPSGETIVYVAKYDGRIISYYHVPIYSGLINGSECRIGVIQAVGVSKDYRKYGVFKLISEFATKDLESKVNFIFTFPNSRSIKTFIKYESYSKICTLPTYILPINIEIILQRITKSKLLANFLNVILKTYTSFKIKKLKNDQAILKSFYIDKNVQKLYEVFGRKHNIKIMRNSDYFNWRYFKFPNRNYQLINLVEGRTIKASVFISPQNILGSQGLVIMDFAYTDFISFEILLSNLNNYLSINAVTKIDFIYISSIFKDHKKLSNTGFIDIPKFLNPRPLNFLVKKINLKDSHLMQKENWLLTLGDWDVF
jgi:hypothetical protein